MLPDHFPPRLLLQAIALAAMTSYIYPADAAGALDERTHTLTLQAAQVQKLGIQSSQVLPASDAGRVTLQGRVTLPPKLLRVISAPVAALVEQVHVSKADAVTAGQPLVLLNAPELVAWQREYQQAQLQLKLASQAAQRDEALLAEGIIAGARAQASRAQLQIAQATARERGQLLQLAGVRPDERLSGHATLSAPGRGSVVDVLVQPGQRVDAGTPLLKFASAGALSIDLQAPADTARRLGKGDLVRVTGCAMPARIVSINTELDEGSQTLSLRAQWPQINDCALPQQRVQAEVALAPGGDAAQMGGWLVPSGAVLRHDGQDIVFVQRGTSFQAVAVQVVGQQAGAGKTGNLTQIRPIAPQHIKAEDKVVSQGTVALKGVLQGLGAQ